MDKSTIHFGLGVIIVNPDGKVLVGRRLGDWAPYYSIPGGKMEAGETFEAAAKREIEEETSLKIEDPRVIAVTNNLETYRALGIHSVSVILVVRKFTGEPMLVEPDKCEAWQWADPYDLPEPHFDASRSGVQCYLEGCFYLLGDLKSH